MDINMFLEKPGKTLLLLSKFLQNILLIVQWKNFYAQFSMDTLMKLLYSVIKT